MNPLQIVYLPIVDLRSYANQTRKHPLAKIKKLAKSLEEFGFVSPIIVDPKTMEIIAGHARVEAAKLCGLENLPTVSVGHLSEAQIKAYRIADNKLFEGSDYDFSALKLEFETILELDFELVHTGFETAEIDQILVLDDVGTQAEETPVPNIADSTYVQLGDIFCLGEHRILCANILDIEIIKKFFAECSAKLVITDPPYNVKINGHVLGDNSAHSEFAMASGEMSSIEFTEFLQRCFEVFYEVSSDGSLHYHFMDHHHLDEILSAGRVYDKRLNVCVWNKTNAGMGSFYRSQHELCCVFKKGEQSHTNNVQLGKFGRNRSNVWVYPGMNTFSDDRDDLLASHPTVKNTQMIIDIILDASIPGDIVLDGFLGSGTTLLAAENTKRIAYGVEIEPKFVEVAIKRFQSVCDTPVIHQQTGLTFDELQKHRAEQNIGGSEHV